MSQIKEIKEYIELSLKIELLEEKIRPLKDLEAELQSSKERLIEIKSKCKDVWGDFQEIISLLNQDKSIGAGNSKQSKRIETPDKISLFNEFLKENQHKDLVPLSEVKEFFEQRTGSKIKNVSQYFSKVIPEEYYNKESNTRNRSIFTNPLNKKGG